MKRSIHLSTLAPMFAVTASAASAEAGQAIAHDGSSISGAGCVTGDPAEPGRSMPNPMTPQYSQVPA